MCAHPLSGRCMCVVLLGYGALIKVDVDDDWATSAAAAAEASVVVFISMAALGSRHSEGRHERYCSGLSIQRVCCVVG